MPQSTHLDLNRSLAALRHGAGHLLDEFYEKIGRHHHSVSGQTAEAVPPADISDSELGLEVEIELPGIDEKDLEVTVTGDRLVVKGEKRAQAEKKTKTKTYYCQERSYGAVERSFWLPPGLDSDKTRATYSDGVLRITMPRKKSAKGASRNIRVGATR